MSTISGLGGHLKDNNELCKQIYVINFQIKSLKDIILINYKEY